MSESNYPMNSVSLSRKQREIIVGKLLGDGHLETRTNGKTFRLKIEHSYKQMVYVDWQYEHLRSIAASPPQKKEQAVLGKVYAKYWFNTVSTGSLRFYGQQWYQDRKKHIPEQIGRWLTPCAIAVWFMDDGSVKSQDHRAKIINTQSFTKSDIERLMSVLDRKYGIRTKLRPQKEGYQIYLLSETIDRFRKVVAPYVIPSMMYKLD